MGKSDRRLARIEERLDALEARLPLLLEKSPQESVMNQAEPGNSGPRESVMNRIHDKIEEAGVDVDNFDDLEQEVREFPGKGLISPENAVKTTKKRDIARPEERRPSAVEARVEGARPERVEGVDLERQAYKLREEGLEWSEIEARLNLKAPWLAAGRWRKKLQLASELE